MKLKIQLSFNKNLKKEKEGKKKKAFGCIGFQKKMPRP